MKNELYRNLNVDGKWIEVDLGNSSTLFYYEMNGKNIWSFVMDGKIYGENESATRIAKTWATKGTNPEVNDFVIEWNKIKQSIFNN